MKNFKDALLILTLLVIPSVSNAQYQSTPPSAMDASGDTPTACKDNALAWLSAAAREWCIKECRNDPNNGMKRFEFPDELVTISPPQPQRWQWNCIASLAQRDQIICECRKKTPPPTPTPTPTPSGIYEQKLEIAIFGENELPTRKE